ncbi:MAG TPA: (2Fe-2S)-binding protein [Polyangiaceae bacterium]|jgi:sarcosine oxidase subunit alpha|nr:(2Fe-2S)-binding protein [Polyangiaceae bacterium]
MPRLAPPRDPVTMHFDGQAVVAERGEPAAVALVAAGHLALARSPKFHRPRGPSCLRAACDGCLARVDGEPNVMTCRVAAAEGMRVETQNVVGSKDTDLLRMADWFFPEGMNHHELLAGVPGVQRVMQAFARRVAGLGRLPKETVAPRPAARRDADVLIVGAGASGMAAALELGRRGRRVEVVDDALTWGGSVRALTGSARAAWEPLLRAFGEAVAAARVSLRLETTAAGIYGDDVLVGGPAGIEVVTARTVVLAPGAHDGVLGFEGNDVPGVMSARAAGWLLGHGVRPGEHMLVTVAEGGGPFGEAVAGALDGVEVVRGVPTRARGSGRVKEVTVVETGGAERRVKCDTLLVDAARGPAYELCAQAGAELRHEPRGYVVNVKAGSRVRPGFLAVGEAVGTALVVAQVVEESRELADA